MKPHHMWFPLLAALLLLMTRCAVKPFRSDMEFANNRIAGVSEVAVLINPVIL